MKFFNLALVVFLGLGSFSAKAMESDPTTQDINSILLYIINSFDNDIQSYQYTESDLNTMINTVDEIDQTRQIFFENMYNSFLDLTNKTHDLIETCSAKDSTIENLELQLQIIQTESEQQIYELQTMITTLSTQLQAAEQAYNDLENETTIKSATILENVNNLKVKYDALVYLRTSFLSLIESLNVRLQDYNNAFTTDQQNLIQISCQTSFIETTTEETCLDTIETTTAV